MALLCKYCNLKVHGNAPGAMLVEDSSGEGFATHEECYQQSDDGGSVGRLAALIGPGGSDE